MDETTVTETTVVETTTMAFTFPGSVQGVKTEEIQSMVMLIIAMLQNGAAVYEIQQRIMGFQ